MIVTRIEPRSLARLAGALYAACGLIAGFFFAIISLVGGMVSGTSGGPGFGQLFGVGAVIFLPILYGGLGFLGSYLMAGLYNVIAKWVGGIEVQIESGPHASPGEDSGHLA